MTPALGLRLPSTPETKRVPPVALTLNVFVALEKKSEFVVSAHTNEPEWAAFARRPAARV